MASVQVDLTEDVLRRLRTDLLERLQRSQASGVVVDVGGVDVMDPHDFGALRRTLSMAAIMGAQSVFCGFKPGVVASLVELGADLAGVRAVRSLDEALTLLQDSPSEAAATPDDGAEIEGNDGVADPHPSLE